MSVLIPYHSVPSAAPTSPYTDAATRSIHVAPESSERYRPLDVFANRCPAASNTRSRWLPGRDPSACHVAPSSSVAYGWPDKSATTRPAGPAARVGVELVGGAVAAAQLAP